MSPSQNQPPIINIEGDKVALGPLRRDLMPQYVKWVNEFQVTRGIDLGIRPITWEAEETWYENTGKSEKDRVFLIYERSSMRPIGNAGLHDIDYFHRTAEFGIIIGEKDCWGKGYGTEVARLILDYGFTALGLHNIMLRVYSFNERGIRAYIRAGFREIGRRRESRRLAGQPYDTIFMDCLATEFQSPVLRTLLLGNQNSLTN